MSDELIEFEDVEGDSPNARTQVLPAFEIIKRDILFSWFSIEKAYREYIRLSSMGKSVRTENLSAMIIALYVSILRPMMKKEVFKETFGTFVEDMNRYIKNDKKIPEEKIDDVMEKFSDFLNIIKLTDISFQIKPWEERFKDSYGIGL